MRRALHKPARAAPIPPDAPAPGWAAMLQPVALRTTSAYRETGIANIIAWPKVFEKYRRVVLSASLLGVEGTLQREGLVIHVVAQRLVDLSHLLGTLSDCDRLNAPLARSE